LQRHDGPAARRGRAARALDPSSGLYVAAGKFLPIRRNSQEPKMTGTTWIARQDRARRIELRGPARPMTRASEATF
jgi:hypothetical protein